MSHYILKYYLLSFTFFAFSMNIFSQKIGKNVPITENTDQLKYFFGSLENVQKEKIRIAHFGDSIIEGDVVTESLRDNLQKIFGGNGAGFISMVPDDYRMRKSASISFSEGWNEASLFKRNPDNLPVGINGSVFFTSDNDWVKYEVSKLSKTLNSFSTVKVFYKDAGKSCSAKYSFDNSGFKEINLEEGANVKELILNHDNAKSIKLEFSRCGKTLFYGVSLENGNGVYVDNFPVKGNSGASLYDINEEVLTDFSTLLNYKLILINFGLNILSPTHDNYDWYEKRMIKVINHFKKAFPQTSFLIISVGDKGIKKGSKFVSDPGIQKLIEAQENVAKKTNTAFWNLFEAMGGKNSINDWVNAGPPLAYKDYAHLSYEGGKAAADLLTTALMKEYENYKNIQNK